MIKLKNDKSVLNQLEKYLAENSNSLKLMRLKTEAENDYDHSVEIRDQHQTDLAELASSVFSESELNDIGRIIKTESGDFYRIDVGQSFINGILIEKITVFE